MCICVETVLNDQGSVSHVQLLTTLDHMLIMQINIKIMFYFLHFDPQFLHTKKIYSPNIITLKVQMCGVF